MAVVVVGACRSGSEEVVQQHPVEEVEAAQLQEEGFGSRGSEEGEGQRMEDSKQPCRP